MSYSTDTDYSKLYRKKDNAFTVHFFSEDNMCVLQNELIHIVQKHTGIKISPQSRTDLQAIMVSVYNLYANTADVYHQNHDPRSEIIRLNKIVLDQASRNVLSGMAMYIQYIKDASRLPIPLDRGLSTTEDKSLQFTKTWIT